MEKKILRVLLADENPETRDRIREKLCQLVPVAIVAEAVDSREALDLFFRHRPDVVLVSVSLPKQGGFEVLRCIKGATLGCVVILTINTTNPFVEKAGRLLGATDVCSTNNGLRQIREILLQLYEDH